MHTETEILLVFLLFYTKYFTKYAEVRCKSVELLVSWKRSWDNDGIAKLNDNADSITLETDAKAQLVSIDERANKRMRDNF